MLIYIIYGYVMHVEGTLSARELTFHLSVREFILYTRVWSRYLYTCLKALLVSQYIMLYYII